MRRTRTTTMLLLGAAGVAVTAVSGCVSVDPGGPPGRGSATAQPGAQNARPQIVQAPVREALEMAGTPSPPAAPPRRTPAPAHRVPPQLSRPGGHALTPERGGLRGPQVADRAEGLARDLGRGKVLGGGGSGSLRPSGSASAKDAAGLCKLGETYGKWPAGSPQARICHETYGH